MVLKTLFGLKILHRNRLIRKRRHAGWRKRKRKQNRERKYKETHSPEKRSI
jgi:hypothetical protein